jgi:4-amino-4-deoxy-L-arabinose transferase-like glycosyltransferase
VASLADPVGDTVPVAGSDAPASSDHEAGPNQRSARFRGGVGIAVIVALGAAVRAAYDVVVMRSVTRGFDAIAYTLLAGALRDGDGYISPASVFSGEGEPTAGFAPGYAAYQAAWGAVFGDGLPSERLSGILPAMVTIAVTASLAGRLLGPRAAWAAAAIVALDPMLIAVDGSGMAENVSVMLVVVALRLGVRMIDHGPGPAEVAGLGVVCGAAVLTRPDLLLLLPLILLLVVRFAPSPGPVRRLLLAGVVVLVAAAVVGPWAWRNQRELGTFTVATLSPTSSLAGANCDKAYAGPALGSWDFDCVVDRRLEDGTEAEQAARYRSESSAYARDHLGRLPLVVAARELRVWGFWVRHDVVYREAVESRHPRWQNLVWPVRLIMVPVGGVGLVLLMRRRDRRTLMLAVPFVIVVASAAVSYGNPRFSAIAHPALAIGLASLADRWWSGRSAAAAH